MSAFQIYRDTAGDYRWRLVDSGTVLAEGGSCWGHLSGARAGVEAFKRAVADAEIVYDEEAS